MSASEKLRVLQASPAYKVREELEHVLPQLRAVVSAAEDEMRMLGKPRPLGTSREDALAAALADLDEALS